VIFHDKFDYDRFLKVSYLSNSMKNYQISAIKDKVFDVDRGKPLVAIGAYVLMPNHFHILLKQMADNGISKFMQKLSTGYCMYFNKKYERTGGLFEGKFKSEHSDDDSYLKYLFSYIHLNPVKLIDSAWKEKGIKNKLKTVKFLEEYPFSSYLDYLGHERKQKGIISPNEFPDYFPTEDSVREDIFDWLTYKP